tara:strand:+ start:4311 stop:4619 length:309 start_codon:yes stop_codon:yes gene_type:complete
VDIIAKRNAKERVNRAEMTSLIHKNVAIRATAELKYLRSVVGANAALAPKLKKRQKSGIQDIVEDFVKHNEYNGDKRSNSMFQHGFRLTSRHARSSFQVLHF